MKTRDMRRVVRPLGDWRNGSGAGEMAQWLGVLAAVAEDQGSIPSAHMVAHSRYLIPVPLTSTGTRDTCGKQIYM